MAQPFEFAIPVSWSPAPEFRPVAWLAEDFSVTTSEHGDPGDPGDPDAEPPRPARPKQPPAVRLKFRLWPTMAERAAITMRTDELFGGLQQTVDVDIALGDMFALFRLEYERAVWPDGRPTATTPAEKKAQNDALDRVWNADAGSAKRQKMQRLETMRDHIRAGANWATLIVQPPPGWEDITRREMEPDVNDKIIGAYIMAKLGAERAAGK